MPLLRPEVHDSGYVLLTEHICPDCPKAWFRTGFGEQETQGFIVRTADGRYARGTMPLAEAIAFFGEHNVFEGGRDGYYLTMSQAARAITDGVHGVHYVDDLNDDWLQDYFICKDDDDHTPYAEAHVPEPPR